MGGKVIQMGVLKAQTVTQGLAKEVQGQLQALQKAQQGALTEMAKAIQALAANQQALMQAVQQVAEVAGAEREAELFVGADGKKRSRSRIIPKGQMQ